MKFTILAPATVEVVIEIKADTLAEAQKLWDEGEFDIVSEENYDYDFDDVNLKMSLNDVIKD